MANQEQWVVWNGSLGVLDLVTIGRVETGAGGRRAYLSPPYDMVGPFDLDELEARGKIAFAACLVMSRRRWQEDQRDLRKEAQAKRRAIFLRFERGADDRAHRQALDLPQEGALGPGEINAAFRRQAKTSHPDAGGSGEAYRRITEARDALLERVPRAS